jgi:Na+/H+ antiporter NhaD/arsenite permease-like protein
MDLLIFITGLFVVVGGIVLLLSIIRHITPVYKRESTINNDLGRKDK